MRWPIARASTSDVVRTKPALAKALGRGVRQITEYLQRGMPREAGSGYSISACREWIAANIRPTGRAADAAPDLNRAKWEATLVRERALRERLRRRREAGELIEVEEVARHNERRIAHAKSLFSQVPDRVLGLLPKLPVAQRKKLKERLTKFVDDVLFAIADEDDLGDDESD